MFDVYAPDGYTKTGGQELRDVDAAICGFESPVRCTWNYFTDEDARVSCPACLKKMAAARLKGFAGAQRLAAVKDETAYGHFRHKQGWRATLDGETIAYLGYQEHAWRVYPLILETWDEQAKADGPYVRNTAQPLDQHDRVASGGLHAYLSRQGDGAYKTRDDALMACLALAERGVLKTGARLIADAAASHRAHAAERAAYKVRRTAAEQARTDTLVGLEEILDKETLTNFQRSALLEAISRFQPKSADD